MSAKKSLGQHFLVSPAHVRRILEVCRGEPGGFGGVLEVGPGRGALTAGLLSLERPFVAVEADGELAETLRCTLPGADIRTGDARRADLAGLAREAGIFSWLVVGNLPYNVGTEILVRILSEPRAVSAAVVMLQREVAEKFCSDGGESYGPLGAWRWAWWRGEALFRVPPGAFAPPPKVVSAVCRFRPKEAPALESYLTGAYRDFLRRCFAAPRKTLLGNLTGGGVDRRRAGELFDRCAVDIRSRPAAVPPEAFARLFSGLVGPGQGP